MILGISPVPLGSDCRALPHPRRLGMGSGATLRLSGLFPPILALVQREAPTESLVLDGLDIRYPGLRPVQKEEGHDHKA